MVVVVDVCFVEGVGEVSMEEGGEDLVLRLWREESGEDSEAWRWLDGWGGYSEGDV